MRDLSTVRGQLPEIQSNGIDVMLLDIHHPPGQDMLTRLNFNFSPTYLIFDATGEEVFRSNSLPTVDALLAYAQ